MKFNYAIILLLLILISCQGDDSDDLVGTWKLSNYRFDCPQEGLSVDYDSQDGCYTDTENNTICFEIYFPSGDMGQADVSLFFGSSSSGEWEDVILSFTRSDNTVTMCDELGDCDTFELQNGKLTFSNSDDGCTEYYTFEKG